LRRGFGGVGECSTVDAYQGLEAERCIVSLMEDLPLLRDPRRTNVMLTRAREMLVLVGDLDYWASQKGNVALAKMAELAADAGLVRRYRGVTMSNGKLLSIVLSRLMGLRARLALKTRTITNARCACCLSKQVVEVTVPLVGFRGSES
jgi:hypothetical protein